MKEPSAFRAVYADWKLVKTRQTIQIVFEIPLSDADAAYDVLGGMPQPAAERWFGIAAIKMAQAPTALPKAEKAPRDWRDMQPAAQCALRCNDATFRAFLTEEYSFRPRTGEDATEQAAAFLRNWFGISSRSELSADHKKRMLWKQLDDQYSAWKALEHA